MKKKYTVTVRQYEGELTQEDEARIQAFCDLLPKLIARHISEEELKQAASN